MLKLNNVKQTTQSGFALIGVLLIVVIIAILAGMAIIAINPNKQLADSHNSQRLADVTAILNGVYQYSADNNSVPPTITTTATEVCATGAASCTGLADLSTLTASTKYLASIPKDPQCTTTCATNGTGYKISKDANNRVTVVAPAAENKTISVTR